MRALIGIALVILPFLGHAFAQGSSVPPGSIRGDVFAKGTNRKTAVLPEARTVLRRPMTKETGLDTKGAFAFDSLPQGTCEIEANALGLSAVLTVDVCASPSSPVQIEMNVAAANDTGSAQGTPLKVMNCAFSRKVHHHA
jgi:hypothetical protein